MLQWFQNITELSEVVPMVCLNVTSKIPFRNTKMYSDMVMKESNITGTCSFIQMTRVLFKIESNIKDVLLRKLQCSFDSMAQETGLYV